MRARRQTRLVRAGDVAIGGGSPVSVQTMANADPHDAKALCAQLASCAALGCDIFRMTVPDARAAETLGEVRKASPIPIVADIHFDYRCALAALEAGADALRINPGNIGGRDRVRAVAQAAKEHGATIRVGVNMGSLEKGLPRTPQGLCDSALRHVAMLEDEGFRDIVISAKASNVADTLEAYRLLAGATDCPLHLGVTEAGTLIPGTVRSSVALGALLAEGIGDTIRVSLTARPECEVRAGMEILRSLGMRPPGASVTSCPTCGRTTADVAAVAARIEEALERRLAGLPRGSRLPRVAVMGCVVNGPGEAKDADVALCGANGEFMVYVKGEPTGRVSEEDAAGRVMEYVSRI